MLRGLSPQSEVAPSSFLWQGPVQEGEKFKFLPGSLESVETPREKCGVGERERCPLPKKKTWLGMFAFSQMALTHCLGLEGYLFCCLQVITKKSLLNFADAGTENLLLRDWSDFTMVAMSRCKYCKTSLCLRLIKPLWHNQHEIH